jgi:hypothetical protein
MKTLLVLATALSLSTLALAQASVPTNGPPQQPQPAIAQPSGESVADATSDTPTVAGKTTDTPELLQAQFEALVANEHQLEQSMSGITEFQQFMAIQQQKKALRQRYNALNARTSRTSQPGASGGHHMAGPNPNNPAPSKPKLATPAAPAPPSK